jgi:hypothetical protein
VRLLLGFTLVAYSRLRQHSTQATERLEP